MDDTRDKRDPQKLGEGLLSIRKNYPSFSLGRVYDESRIAREADNYPQDESLAMVTAREYREQLERRAREGDKYAASALESLNSKGKVEGFDDAGS